MRHGAVTERTVRAKRRYDSLTVDEKIDLALRQIPLALSGLTPKQLAMLSFEEREARLKVFVKSKASVRSASNELGIDKGVLSRQIKDLPDWYRNLLSQISEAANRKGLTVGEPAPAVSKANKRFYKKRKREIADLVKQTIEEMT